VQPPTLEPLPEAVARNVAIARTRTRALIMAVVKADGYGHGAIAAARAAVAAGAAWIGTTDIAEASKLRATGLTVPILTWLNPSGVDAEAAAADRIDVAIGSVEELEAALEHASSRVRVHLNLDTGMAREGCPMSGWKALIARASEEQQRGRIGVVGLMGHLPLADQARPEANEAAVERLRQARRAIMAAGFRAPLTHLAATAGTLCDPATHFGMVRLGAGLVGIDPSGTTELHGASRLTAPIVHSATVTAGTAVGYGGTYVTDTSTNLGVLPLGYADGIPREIGPEAAVEIRGRRYQVVGRVSMDQIVIDTGAASFPRGTTATVFAPRGGLAPTIAEWARWAGTIPHTIVTGIGPRVRRTSA
jgi:alanine racemase